MEEQTAAEAKQSIAKALERLGLTPFVSLEEIEKELIGVETAFQSRLLLGIIRRIMHRQDDAAAELFIPAVTEWKNYLPHKDLGGLTPHEHREKYPPGRYETQFLAGLMNEYQATLDLKKPDETFDVESNFNAFQNEYFNRIPFEQPFTDGKKKFMTLREIIIEERHRNNYPSDSIKSIGAKLFAENTAEGMGECVAELDDVYMQTLNEFTAMQNNPRLRNRARICEIKKLFERDEPYHRCGPEPHSFYLNYAMAMFLNGDAKSALALLDTALEHKPDYTLARQMKERINAFRQ